MLVWGWVGAYNRNQDEILTGVISMFPFLWSRVHCTHNSYVSAEVFDLGQQEVVCVP